MHTGIALALAAGLMMTVAGVAATPALLRLMQLPGINYKGAFALAAAVGDVRRFATPAKLAAYGGFAPVVGTSGEEEARAKRRGGTGRPLDGEGRRDIKFFFTEAAQAVMRSCGGTDLGRWGRALFNRGKDWNKAVCAVGRKLLVYAWHVMAGHPAPGREGEELFARKMRAFHKKVGARRMRQLGHGSAASFAARMARDVYGHLPQPACDADKLPGGKDLEKLNEHRDPCGAAVPT